MELALVSGQSRAEVLKAKFKAVRNGHWWFERGKTGARICLPLNLKLDCLGKTGLDFAPRTPPTFHEIRSLAVRLYKAQGNISRQELLGHKDEKTTLVYEDGRGEWIKVNVPK